MCIEFRRYAKVELIRCPSAAETERRQTFRDEIVGQLPFDLIGLDDTLPSVEISVSEAEDSTSSHYDTLKKHHISGAYPNLRCNVTN